MIQTSENLSEELKELIKPTYFFDYDTLEFQEYFDKYYNFQKTPFENLIDFYYIVRDSILYNPYNFKIKKSEYKASNIIKFKKTYCIPKAILYSTIARKLGFPSKIGFADVKNHLSSKRFIEYLGSDVFAFHGYSEIYIFKDNPNNGKWVKATPAFDKYLCEKYNVPPLNFDGENDSIFHPFDNQGKKFMEYINERGSFSDFPYEYIMKGLQEYYPHLWNKSKIKRITGDIRNED
jgi:transglutaminase-like putative cysteine protease